MPRRYAELGRRNVKPRGLCSAPGSTSQHNEKPAEFRFSGLFSGRSCFASIYARGAICAYFARSSCGATFRRPAGKKKAREPCGLRAKSNSLGGNWRRQKHLTATQHKSLLDSSNIRYSEAIYLSTTFLRYATACASLFLRPGALPKLSNPVSVAADERPVPLKGTTRGGTSLKRNMSC